jgi:hypothetical protein
LRQRIFKKNCFAEYQVAGHSIKNFFKKNIFFFAECQMAGHSAQNFQKKILCRARWLGTRQRFFLKKGYFCRGPDGRALGKEFPNFFVESRLEGHSAKNFPKKKYFDECQVEGHSAK